VSICEAHGVKGYPSILVGQLADASAAIPDNGDTSGASPKFVPELTRYRGPKNRAGLAALGSAARRPAAALLGTGA